MATHTHIHIHTDDDWSPEARQAAMEARKKVVANRAAAKALPQGRLASTQGPGTQGGVANRMAVVAARRAQQK